MHDAPVTVLGLPLVAVVSSSYDAHTGESDAEVVELYWRRRDGSRGKHVSDKVWDKIESTTWGLCGIIEQVCDHAGYENYLWNCAVEIAPRLFQGGVQDNETIDGLFQFDLS